MLLLSVSEAKVCSVDMDEMSLADDDWEAEPDTTSATRDTHRHKGFSASWICPLWPYAAHNDADT